MEPRPEQLGVLPLFASGDEGQLGQLVRWTEVRGVAAGERVTPQGASAYSFFVIEEGTADVIRDGQPVGTLGPGDFFGEIAIMDGGRRTADVVATSAITLIVKFGTEFREMESEMPVVVGQIRATMKARQPD